MMEELSREIEKSNCEEVLIQVFSSKYKQDGLLEIKKSDTIPSKEFPNVTRPYLYQPYWSYLTSNDEGDFQRVDVDDSSDKEILKAGADFYQNKLIPGYTTE